MSQIHRAKWIIIDPQRVIENGYIAANQGQITDFGRCKAGMSLQVRDYGSGVIFPLLVNAHTHLELSALAGKISMKQGFLHWVRELVRQRELTSREVLIKGAVSAIESLKASGCGAVGDIATLGLTERHIMAPLLIEASSTDDPTRLRGVWFHEYLGDIPAELIRLSSGTETMTCSIAGHAPHTTSPAVLTAAKTLTRNAQLPFSIHVSESELESIFIRTAKGLWADFLKTRGIDPADWGLPAPSPVIYADRLGILDSNTIAVHLLSLDNRDYEILSRRKVRICLCPRSNQNLHQRLPDIPGMIERGFKPCLGTDSLASVESLSMLDEAAFTAEQFSALAPEILLAMITVNGAEALGWGHRLGTLDIGKDACFGYADISSQARGAVIETLIQQPKVDRYFLTVNVDI